MKYAALISVVSMLITLVHGNVNDTKIECVNIREKCLSNPNRKIIEDMEKKAIKGEKVADSVFGTYVRCMYANFGIQNENGDVDRNALGKKLGSAIDDLAKLQEVMGKCKVQKGNPEEAAVAMFECTKDYIFKTNPQIS